MTSTGHAPPTRPKVLCVDDEPNVLAALSLHLRRKYEVRTASSGAAGLALLLAEPDVAVIVSDMRMPAMDGVAFLAEARRAVPLAARLLLTGHADLDSAIGAINEGRIFRFLTKPCVPTVLLNAVDAAAEQHRLISAERVLLEKTLRGSIAALTDVLALTNPTSFGRASRLRAMVTALAHRLGLEPSWPVEVAAMVSQLGCIVLPTETAERLYLGESPSEQDQRMLERVPEVTDRLLAHIPRLESVRAILARHEQLRADADCGQDPSDDPTVESAARILVLASDLDMLESRGTTRSEALGELRSKPWRYGTPSLTSLGELLGAEASAPPVHEVAVYALTEGMIFVDDVRTTSGTLLVARGFELTAALVERLQNLPDGSVREPLRVRLSLPTRN